MDKKIDAGPPEMTGTKWKLFKTAIDLFAEKGYPNVSIRDLAAATSLNPASIYNHFTGKEAFLTEAFEFYKRHFYEQQPIYDDAIAMIPHSTPREIFDKVQFVFETKLFDLMTKISLIAVDERHHNAHAADLVYEIFSRAPREYLGGLLQEMVNQKKIAPFDIDGFVKIYSALCLYGAARIGEKTPDELTSDWRANTNFIFESLPYIK